MGLGQQQQDAGGAPPPFRVDVTVHELLMNKTRPRPSLLPTGPPKPCRIPSFRDARSCSVATTPMSPRTCATTGGNGPRR